MEKFNRDLVKSSLLTILCNATGIYRKTITANQKKKYQHELKVIIKKLTEKIDDESITNQDIRHSIKNLSKFCDSIGASQKAINVYLKFYSILSGKDDQILKELDCPIDSFVIKANGLERISLNKLGLKKYNEMQNKLENNHGIRILADIRAWDSKKGY